MEFKIVSIGIIKRLFCSKDMVEYGWVGERFYEGFGCLV